MVGAGHGRATRVDLCDFSFGGIVVDLDDLDNETLEVCKGLDHRSPKTLSFRARVRE